MLSHYSLHHSHLWSSHPNDKLLSLGLAQARSWLALVSATGKMGGKQGVKMNDLRQVQLLTCTGVAPTPYSFLYSKIPTRPDYFEPSHKNQGLLRPFALNLYFTHTALNLEAIPVIICSYICFETTYQIHVSLLVENCGPRQVRRYQSTAHTK